ncbi:hypothetical protein N185_16025 [Sinorhizobium sp. GW3]|nr:hypothetical protein N185_16025 [Sinorhizobium sp. GW3]
MTISTQARIAFALRQEDSPLPEGLAAWNGSNPERRFAIYRNNVVSGLIGAVQSRFPIAQKIVGEAFFAGMACAFVREHPPHSPLLLAYGDEFADFVEGFEPAKEVEYLADVIRLEAARSRAYHASDATPFSLENFGMVSQERLASLTFVPHPSLSIIKSSHPVVTIWGMNVGELEFAPIVEWCAEDALVVRPEMIVTVHRLPVGGATFLTALADGVTLGAAAERAFEAAGNFDVGASLAGAIQIGAFIGMGMDDDDG